MSNRGRSAQDQEELTNGPAIAHLAMPASNGVTEYPLLPQSSVLSQSGFLIMEGGRNQLTRVFASGHTLGVSDSVRLDLSVYLIRSGVDVNAAENGRTMSQCSEPHRQDQLFRNIK